MAVETELLAIARGILGRKLRARLDPEDVVQDAWVRAIQRWPGVRHDVDGYLRRQVSHEAHARLREHRDERRDIGRDRRMDDGLPVPSGQIDHADRIDLREELSFAVEVATRAPVTAWVELIIRRVFEGETIRQALEGAGYSSNKWPLLRVAMTWYGRALQRSRSVLTIPEYLYVPGADKIMELEQDASLQV